MPQSWATELYKNTRRAAAGVFVKSGLRLPLDEDLGLKHILVRPFTT